MNYKKERKVLIMVLILIVMAIMAFVYQIINVGVFAVCLVFIILITIFSLLYIFKLDNEDKKKELNQLLYYDPVTNLANKNKFLNDVKLNVKKSRKYAIIVFDMKNFKAFVDLNGLNETNRYLKYIANILKKNISNNELCANIVDEHFALLCEYNYSIDLVKRIKDINTQIVNYNSNLNIELSFGIYCINDKRFSSVLMFNKADLARKSIVNKYDVLYAFYDNEMRENSIELSDIENYMESSLSDKKFIVDYQPKYAINRKKLIGFEALIRWNHPKRGILFPNKFVPIFEKNGFIRQLDFYVLEEVCKVLKNSVNFKHKISISLNLSREDLKNNNLINDINRHVDKYKINHELIEFEFTESIVFDNINLFIEVVKELKKLGYKTSIDDFGTGQSSLNALKNLPVDILKIDKEFLENNNKNGRTIIKDIIKLAKKLNMKVIVEGIETKEEVKMLRELNCDYGQGYYYSKPLIKKEMEKLLKKN